MGVKNEKVFIHQHLQEYDLISAKSDVDRWDITKLQTVSTDLTNLKFNIAKLDAVKLKNLLVL